MPHMTGDELAGKIREIRPHLPILIMTGLATQSPSETIKSAQVDKVVMKPLTTREIARAIRQVLDGKGPDT